MYEFDHSVSYDSAFYVDVAMKALLNLGYLLGIVFINKLRLNPKIIVIIGGAMIVSGVLLSSMQKNFWNFVLLYGVFFGLGSGITYMLPLQLIWEYYPQNKGLYSGILLGAYGFGPFIFAQLTTRLVNPHDLGFSIVIDHHDGTTPIKFYGPKVANNTPKMLRITSYIWTGLLILAIILIFRRSTKRNNLIEQIRKESSNSEI